MDSTNTKIEIRLLSGFHLTQTPLKVIPVKVSNTITYKQENNTVTVTGNGMKWESIEW